MEEQCKHEHWYEKEEDVTAFFNNGLELGYGTSKYTSSCRFLNTVCKDCGETVISNVYAIWAGIKDPDHKRAAEWQANKDYWYGLEFDHREKEGENKMEEKETPITLSDIRAGKVNPEQYKKSVIDMMVSIIPTIPGCKYEEMMDNYKSRSLVKLMTKKVFNVDLSEEDIDDIFTKLKIELNPNRSSAISADKAGYNYVKPSDKLLEGLKEDANCPCQMIKTETKLDASEIPQLRDLVKVTTIMPSEELPDTLQEFEKIRQTYTCRRCGRTYTKEEIIKRFYKE